MTITYPMNPTFISEYSRKIFSFALSRTGNHHDAEDLAQEILLSLHHSLRSGKEIENMDAWVHRICCYTWTNFLHKQKRHWRNADLEGLSLPSDGPTIEDHVLLQESMDRLQRELAFLTRLHRRIIVMHYYDNRKVESIAQALELPLGTVKWHLFEARKKMKEAMNHMESSVSLSYQPVVIRAGHSGQPGPNNEPNSYFNSLLSGNIFAAAYEKPETAEGIARKLGVATAYVEDYLEKYIHADLLRDSGGGRYQTNFIIDNQNCRIAVTALLKEKAESIATRFYHAIADKLPDIRRIGFHGSHLPDDFLLWTFLPYAIDNQYDRVKDPAYYARYQPDERKDGGKYYVNASIQYSEQENRERIPDYDIVRKYQGNMIKFRKNRHFHGLQMETWWSGNKWRDFDSTDVMDMARFIELLETKVEPAEYDKLLISRLAGKHFAARTEGCLECRIPFFKKSEFAELHSLLEEGLQSIGAKEILEQVHDDFVALWKGLSPAFISNKEATGKGMREGNSIVFAILEYLVRENLLTQPSEEDKERLTTLMWLSE